MNLSYRNKRRLWAVLLVLSLFFAVPMMSKLNPVGEVYAETYLYECTVTSNSLNVRKGPGTGYEKLGTLTKGATFKSSQIKNGWAKLNFKGTTGYVSSNYITVKELTKKETVVEVRYGKVTSDTLNVRKGPGISYARLGVLEKGDVFKILEENGSYYKLNFAGSVGYALKDYVSVYTEQETKIVDDKSTSSASSYIIVESGSLNVRSGPGTSYSRIGVLTQNEKLELLDVIGSWCKIKYGNGVGYCVAQYVRIEGPLADKLSNTGNEEIRYAVVNESAEEGAELRRGAGTEYQRLDSIPQGGVVRIIEELEGWCRVSYRGTQGFVMSSFLKEVEGDGLVSVPHQVELSPDGGILKWTRVDNAKSYGITLFRNDVPIKYCSTSGTQYDFGDVIGAAGSGEFYATVYTVGRKADGTATKSYGGRKSDSMHVDDPNIGGLGELKLDGDTAFRNQSIGFALNEAQKELAEQGLLTYGFEFSPDGNAWGLYEEGKSEYTRLDHLSRYAQYFRGYIEAKGYSERLTTKAIPIELDFLHGHIYLQGDDTDITSSDVLSYELDIGTSMEMFAIGNYYGLRSEYYQGELKEEDLNDPNELNKKDWVEYQGFHDDMEGADYSGLIPTVKAKLPKLSGAYYFRLRAYSLGYTEGEITSKPVYVKGSIAKKSLLKIGAKVDVEAGQIILSNLNTDLEYTVVEKGSEPTWDMGDARLIAPSEIHDGTVTISGLNKDKIYTVYSKIKDEPSSARIVCDDIYIKKVDVTGLTYELIDIGDNSSYSDEAIPALKFLAGEKAVLKIYPYPASAVLPEITVQDQPTYMDIDNSTRENGYITVKFEDIKAEDEQEQEIVFGYNESSSSFKAIGRVRLQVVKPKAAVTITLDPNAGEALSKNTLQTNMEGKLDYLPTPKHEEYTFLAWKTEDGKTVGLNTVFTEDTTLYADWGVGSYGEKHLLTMEKSGLAFTGTGSISKGSISVAEGSKVILSAKVSADEKFIKWVVKDKDGNSILVKKEDAAYTSFVMPKTDVTISYEVQTNTAHVHNSVYMERMEPTAESYGIEEFWTCGICAKMFRDEALTIPIYDIEELLIPAHKVDMKENLDGEGWFEPEKQAEDTKKPEETKSGSGRSGGGGGYRSGAIIRSVKNLDTYSGSNWKLENGSWYLKLPDGSNAKGWAMKNSHWFYLNPEDGHMLIGWQFLNEKWYYMNSDGVMLTGWVEVNGKWYYLTANGDMLSDTVTPDGYRVGQDGAWIP